AATAMAGGAARSPFAAIAGVGGAAAGSGFVATSGAAAAGSGFAAATGAGGGADGSGFAAATGAGGGAAGSGVAATTGAGGGAAAAAAGWGSPAGEATCNGASDAVRTPALTVSVLTSTGRIGSVEPATTRACVGVAAAAGSDRIAAGSAGAALRLKRTGRLVALATANRGSALAPAFGSSFRSPFAAPTFGSGLVTTMGSGLDSGLGSAFATAFGSGLASALVTTIGSGLKSDVPLASATIGAVRLIEACAIFSLISSRIFASRLPPLLPPMTTATRQRFPRFTQVTTVNPEALI